jgi:hypothetical protein
MAHGGGDSCTVYSWLDPQRTRYGFGYGSPWSPAGVVHVMAESTIVIGSTPTTEGGECRPSHRLALAVAVVSHTHILNKHPLPPLGSGVPRSRHSVPSAPGIGGPSRSLRHHPTVMPEKGTKVCGAAFLVADGPNFCDFNVYIRPIRSN